MPTGPLQAVTFDFWSTLVDGAVNPERTAARLARLHNSIVGAGFAIEPEALSQAFRRAGRRIRQAAVETLQEVGPPGRWAVMAHEIGIPDGAIPFEVVEKAYEDITMQPMPALMPSVDVAVKGLKAAGYRLGVICNTGMAGGRVLRQVLAHYDLLDCFDTTTWSDEFGWSKPDPRIFAYTLEALGLAPSQALHVGDLEELDVEGARRGGLYAARYVPGAGADAVTEADLLVTDWREFPNQIAELQAKLAASMSETAGESRL